MEAANILVFVTSGGVFRISLYPAVHMRGMNERLSTGIVKKLGGLQEKRPAMGCH